MQYIENLLNMVKDINYKRKSKTTSEKTIKNIRRRMVSSYLIRIITAKSYLVIYACLQYTHISEYIHNLPVNYIELERRKSIHIWVK